MEQQNHILVNNANSEEPICVDSSDDDKLSLEIDVENSMEFEPPTENSKPNESETVTDMIHIRSESSELDDLIVIDEISMGKDSVNADSNIVSPKHIGSADTNDDILIVDNASSEIDSSKTCSDNNHSGTHNCSTKDVIPSITISFRSDEIYNTYCKEFMNVISSCPNLRILSQNNCVVKLVHKCDSTEVKPESSKGLFTLDTTPSTKVPNSTVYYQTKFKLNPVEDDVESGSENKCYKCGKTGHMARECTDARYNVNNRPKNVTRRYHIEYEKHKDSVPGKVSSKLREALKLHKHQLPPYIYGMRKMGYPPGWLEEAKISKSNLEMFGTDDENVKNSEEASCRIDPDKIIEYPGYNAPLGDYSDDYLLFGVPAYSTMYSKEAMVAFLQNVYKPKEDETICSTQTAQDNNSITDNNDCSIIDIDDDIEIINSSISSSNSNNDTNNCEETNNVHQKNTSQSLTELEVQKAKILRELAETNNDSELLNTADIEERAVKTTCYGTPIIKSSSLFAKLPQSEKFAKDVSPLIFFENLPNSTGKFEQMSGVLERVRNVLKRSQNCASI